MKNISEIILKEKNKKQPNKKYIQFLQQLLDKQDSVRHLISEMKQKQYLDELEKQNFINMDDWFSYSGMVEEGKNLDRWVYKNSMVDKLKEYKDGKN
ncbi:MAG: hypothetical protein GOVbin1629_11 [Prokaryotic dsDNA virus sp.]|nr:MAG: hypothetical protein GOVbin1629_11 [Prokaryotic dsDNA virus sp.]|tara:strand:+ start:301 stop:591 length:291 start_codon:yes stop_codon:yes gene_type:complete